MGIGTSGSIVTPQSFRGMRQRPFAKAGTFIRDSYLPAVFRLQAFQKHRFSRRCMFHRVEHHVEKGSEQAVFL